MAPMFRYFLGFQVDRDRAEWITLHLPPVGNGLFGPLPHHLLHLTLCTIAETGTPHPFLRQRVASAFADGLPAASPIPFGRIVSRAKGAELVTTGSTAGIRHAYDRIVARLAPYDIEPWYRLSGLRPHITLGYGACEFDPVALAWHWIPRDLVLIESHIGHQRHRVLQSWRLPPPAQRAFAFMRDELPTALRQAA